MRALKTLQSWLQPSRRVVIGFVSLSLLLVALLLFLVMRLWRQDQALEQQRIQARLEIAGNEIALQLEAAYSRLLQRFTALASGGPDSLESSLLDFSGSLADDGLVLSWTESKLRVFPDRRLLYVPDHSIGIYSEPYQLKQGLELEYKQGDLAAAAEFYRGYCDASDPQLRAESLLNLGRVLFKAGRKQEAVEAFNDLMQCGEINISGIPAELMAIERKATILSETGTSSLDLQVEITPLLRGLFETRWNITRGIFDFYLQRAVALWEDFAIEEVPYPPDLERRQRLAEIVTQFVERRNSSGWNEAQSGQEVQFPGENTPYQVVILRKHTRKAPYLKKMASCVGSTQRGAV